MHRDDAEDQTPTFDPDILDYYELGRERERLTAGGNELELVRTRELLNRYLPPAPADVLDVGGGAGVYASWLAMQGYRAHLIDPVPLHVEQAREAAAAQPDHPFTASSGDARRIAMPDASFDAVLLFGPLYHLTERAERVTALAEARRVSRPGGIVMAAVISRFASLLDGLLRGFLFEPGGAAIAARDLRDGQHRNPDLGAHFRWFTTAYFHHPDELAEELGDAGLDMEALVGIEGPGWLFPHHWDDPGRRPAIVDAARAVEREHALLGVSSHLMAVARIPADQASSST